MSKSRTYYFYDLYPKRSNPIKYHDNQDVKVKVQENITSILKTFYEKLFKL